MYFIVIASAIVALAAGGSLDLTDANFEAVTKEGNVFVKFYAPWCYYCNKMYDGKDTLLLHLVSSDIQP